MYKRNFYLFFHFFLLLLIGLVMNLLKFISRYLIQMILFFIYIGNDKYLDPDWPESISKEMPVIRYKPNSPTTAILRKIFDKLFGLQKEIIELI